MGPRGLWAVLACGVVLPLGSCAEKRHADECDGPWKYRDPPPPLSLQGCRTKVSLPRVQTRGIAVQTEVSLTLVGGKLRADVVYELHSADGQVHSVRTPVPKGRHGPIPHPDGDDPCTLEGSGFTLTTGGGVHAVVRPGRPLRVEERISHDAQRGQWSELSAKMLSKGAGGDWRLPRVRVYAPWQGCPVVTWR